MIHVESRLEPQAVASDLLERAAAAVLAHEGAQGDLSVVLADDAQLRDLNNKYLGIDASTDVLSFSSGEADPDSGATYLGDVILSIPTAERQARDAGHPVATEVQLLVVHGVLHLLGHDHAQAEAKALMWGAQADILKTLGIGDIAIHE
jgi:probable rRNA maturation factor